jgi:hypothetical protein
MATKKKAISKKLIIAIILLAILAIATAAIVYTIQTSSPKPIVPGVHVGDTFIYKLTGDSYLNSSEAVTPSYLSEYNNTDYYQVTITGINGSTVSFITDWRFINGTIIQTPEWVDIANGNNSGDFWAIYPPNLNVNNLLSPKGYDELIVNSTATQTFAGSTRSINHWEIDNVFYDVNDPTYSTQRYDIMSVDFDKQTGILDTLINVQEYNSPQYNIIITWQLTNSTVWGV